MDKQEERATQAPARAVSDPELWRLVARVEWHVKLALRVGTSWRIATDPS
ncbi:hypothetical protein ACN28S_13645 [Cystobacter fuscus]